MPEKEVRIIKIPSVPGTRKIHQDPMAKNWSVLIELTFPVLDYDVTHRYEGDAEIDYARRAVERIRRDLESLIRKINGGYHIVSNNDKTLARRVL